MDIIDKIIKFIGQIPIIIWEIVAGFALNAMVVPFILLIDDTLLQFVFFVVLVLFDIGGIIALLKFVHRSI